MAVAMWIRENMLDTSDQSDRPLTEAELKVQRSLQKLSIPEWYLNKRSVPPKILSNVTPIESRPPSWKNPPAKKKSTYEDPKIFSRHPSGAYRSAGKIDDKLNVIQSKASTVQPKSNGVQPILNSNSNIYQIPRKIETWLEGKENCYANSINYPTFNVRPRRAFVSKTFPKVSPSRKVQNINLVFPPRAPKLEISNDSRRNSLLNDALCESQDDSENSGKLILKKRDNIERRGSSESSEEEYRPIYESPMKDIQEEDHTAPSSSPSTSSSSSSSSTEDLSMIMKTPDPKNRFKIPAVSTPDGSPVPIFTPVTEKDTKFKARLPSWYIRTRAFFEGLTSSSGVKKQSVEEKSQNKADTEVAVENSKKIGTRSSHVKALNFDTKESCYSSTEEEDDGIAEKFFNSRNKSMELENIVKNQLRNGKTLIQDRIEAFTHKGESSSSRRNSAMIQKGVQNHVKKLVSALENGCKGDAQVILEQRRKIQEDEESGNESDVKSAASSTSISIKDSDSDSDPQSPSLPSSGSDRFHYDMDWGTRKSSPEVKTAAKEEKQENDGVYWIKVPKVLHMPRTSSLLSIISRPPTTGENSPCVSPIKCVNDCPPTVSSGAWGQTFRKPNNPYNQLFRIDETGITDSGYSEKSDWSAASSSGSMADVSWSTQSSAYHHYLGAQISRSIVC